MSNEDDIAGITDVSVQEFKVGGRSHSELRVVIARYLAKGQLAEISQGELIDLLGVSSQSILELAGYSEAEQVQVMDILGKLTDDEIDAQRDKLA